MNEKYLKIPLTENRHISIKLTQQANTNWHANITNEALTDIEEYFNSGFYKLDPDKQIEMLQY